MSINVTVTGNPVSVKRGQMFMSEIDNFKKKETIRRRKARLEQVRQQSKDLASDLRDKSKYHTSNLMSNLEKQQAETIKKLTAKKLLNLHQQYDECLENLGEAHRLAAKEGSPSRYLEKKRKQNFKKCNERGKKALHKLHTDLKSNDEVIRKSKCRKILNRNIENIRSDMITQLNKSKTPGKKSKKKDKQKKSQKINASDCENRENSNDENMETYRISDKYNNDENIFSRVAAGDCRSQDQIESSRRLICSDRFESSAKPLESFRAVSNRIESSRPFESSRPYSANHIEDDYNRMVKSTRSSCFPNSHPKEYDKRFPEPDTRLSQLISSRKHRQCSNADIEKEFKFNNNEYNPSDYNKPTREPPKDCSCKPSLPVSRPIIPTPCDKPVEVPLLEVTDITDDSLNTQNSITKPPKSVQLYDHKNRFTQQYIPKSDIVRKTFADKGIVYPEEDEKLAFTRLERQRDFEAKRRGREALERERIKRDHDHLLMELANIRKGEQIVNTFTRNKDGHLSEARLRDKNTKHQLNIEAAFENMYKPPESQLITTEPVRRPQTRIKFIDLPESTEKINVNVGKWESLAPTTSHRATTDTIDSVTQIASDRITKETGSLRNLLERVSMQRKLLRNELANFTSSTTVPASKSVSVQSEDTKSAIKPKRKIIKKSSESIRSSLKTKTTEVSSKSKKSESRESIKRSLESEQPSTRISNDQSNKNEESNQTLDKVPTKQSTEEIIAEKEKIVDLRAAGGGATSVQQNLPSEIKILVQKDSERPVNIKLPDSKNDMNTCEDAGGSGIQIIIKLNDNQSAAPITTDSAQITSGTNTQSVPTKVAATSPAIKWITAFEKKPEMKESSTSTSYFSPPARFSVARDNKPKTIKPFLTREIISEPAQRRMQTAEMSTPNQKLDDKTKELIQKLLSMSRGSIDRLEVSSSDVCTPDLNVIQTRANLENFLSDADETLLNELFQITGNSSELRTESERSKSSTFGSIASPEPTLRGYSELATVCTQRIDKLTDMIDKVRKETHNLYTYNPENTAQTSYLQLPSSPDPSTKGQPAETQLSSFKDILGVKPVQSNMESTTEGLLNDKYFSIPRQQTNLQMFQSQSSSETKKGFETEENGYPTQTEENGYPTQSSSSNSRERNSHESSATSSSSSGGMENGKKLNKKPLPTVVQCSKKYNMDISGAPAKELSTILEDTSRNVDTLVQNLQATEIDDKEVYKSSSSSSDTSGEQHVSIDPKFVSYSNQFHSLPDVSQSTSSKVFMELSSTNDVLQSLDLKLGDTQINNNSSNSSSDSLDEALKQLGLGWAITTLRKTQQTMQLSSSSSSNSSKNVSKPKRNLSDQYVSLKDLLRQQHTRQLLQTTVESSSTSIESFEISPTIKKLLDYLPTTSKLPEQILKEFQKLDEPGGRTSTPVLKRNLEQNLFIMNQSDDISVIKKPNSLDSFLSLTMPDHSLDISKTMQRSVSS